VVFIVENILNLIVSTLKEYDFIDCALLFGNFGTDDFMDDSDIDIAILTNKKISYIDLLGIEELLENKVGVKVDLNILDELPEHIQLDISIRNEALFIRDYKNFDKYLDKLNYWYKTEYPFWIKLMSERGRA